MLPIPDMTALDVAFGNISAMPAWNKLPEDYRHGWNNRSGGCAAASGLFFKGGKLSDFGLKPRDGVDVGKAMAVIGACLRSFEPKHEHKIAGVGYLIDQWFEAVK